MCAATDKIGAIQILKPIVWSPVQHLPKIVRQIKSRPAIDLVVGLPIIWSEHALVADPIPYAVDSDAFNLVKSQFTEARCFAPPIDVWMTMRDRNEQVEGAHVFWAQASGR